MCEYTYSLVASHCSDLLTFMDEQRKLKDENLCDVRFIVGNDSVYAHRGVLAVCSAYFQGLLSGAFYESQGDDGTKNRMMELDFTGSVSNVAHLDTLLSAAYTGSLRLSPANITGVTELACFLLVERVRAVCEVFLLETLTLHTCLRYLKLAYRYDLTILFKAARQLLQARFHDYFIHQPEMLTIPAGCLSLVPKIYKYMDLHNMVQFLVTWVEGELDGGEVSTNREERLNTACTLLTDSRVTWKAGGQGISPSNLVGNADIIQELLSRAFDQDGQVLRVADSSGAAELETESMDVSEAFLDPKEFTECSSLCQVSRVIPTENSTDNYDSDHGDLSDEEDSDSLTAAAKSSKPQTDSAVPCGSCDDTQSPSSGNSHNQKRDLEGCSYFEDSVKKQKTTDTSIILNRKVKENVKLNSDACEVIVAFAPGKRAVSYFTATDCEKDRPRFCAIDFEVCLYDIQRRQWLWAGTATFPEKFEERDSWRVTCVKCKAYFLSVHRQTMYVLDLKKMEWSPLTWLPLMEHFNKHSLNWNKIRSLIPIAVDNTLYVLASDRLWSVPRHEYLCTQHYFRLTPSNTWEMVAGVEHYHTATPLTILTVSDSKVSVIKATIAVNLEKSMLIVKEGHIFDSVKGEITKFSGTTYAASPMRILVRDSEIHMVDGDCLQRHILLDMQAWEDLGKVDLSDIKIARAASGVSYLPCLSHCSTSMGESVWEFSAFLDHRSVITELRLNEEHKAQTMRHPPPPFRYVTAMSACELSKEFVNSLRPCRYLHSGIRE